MGWGRIVAFVAYALSRKIVTSSVSEDLKTARLSLHALHMAAWAVADDLTGPAQHSGGDSNYVSPNNSDRIVEYGGDTVRRVQRRQISLSVWWDLVPQGSRSPGRCGLTHLIRDPSGVFVLICRLPAGHAVTTVAGRA